MKKISRTLAFETGQVKYVPVHSLVGAPMVQLGGNAIPVEVEGAARGGLT